MQKINDEHWMRLALEQAQRARGKTSPNPMVGAVLVRGKKCLAMGYHQKAGLPHAEIEALRQIKNSEDATLYVTLEPCCHTNKKTPPCTEAILKSGLRRVVVGCLDPNPQVSGRGIKILRRAGIEVVVGVLKKDCEELNRDFFHWMQTGQPRVMLKMASSVDGKMALANGESQWITGPEARKQVHELRAGVDAILVGVGTVLADDPQLNVRGLTGVSQPKRIILDPALKIPEKAKVLSPSESPAIVVTVEAHLKSPKAARLTSRGIRVVSCPQTKSGEFQLRPLLKKLGKMSILSLMVEGGSQTWTGFYRQKLFQEIQLFMAPKILGGDARGLLQPLDYTKLSSVFELTVNSMTPLGKDWLWVLTLADKNY